MHTYISWRCDVAAEIAANIALAIRHRDTMAQSHKRIKSNGWRDGKLSKGVRVTLMVNNNGPGFDLAVP